LSGFLCIFDSNGFVVVKYEYDAWGSCKVLDMQGNDITYKENDETRAVYKNELGNLNPFRYRGYYYDVETGLYFLKTRYYDPEIGRFFCCLMWCYIDNKSNIRVERERPIFDKKESCSCDIVLQFQHIGEDYYESEIGIGFQICHTITSYGLNFFMGWKFFNYKTEKLKKHLKQAFLEVQNMGLEKVSKLYES
jgi:RHS repeat-associated protein